ncbi:MAG: DUF2914 domain-containing protein [Gemmatimonadales bacterium]|nr:MAG: DUF2914 domain-containing protein [Gemmatimonadales bacterium]
MRVRTIPLLVGLPLLAAFPLAQGALAQGGAEDEQGTVTVELVIATGVEDREPVGSGESFPADVGRLFAWLRVTDGAGQTLRVVWIHGENRFPVSLEIGGSPWRSWSSKQIPPEWTGPWTVEVQAPDGSVIQSTTVTVGDDT